MIGDVVGDMGALERLTAIEGIKLPKARYFRCMVTKDWDGFSFVSPPMRRWT